MMNLRICLMKMEMRIEGGLDENEGSTLDDEDDFCAREGLEDDNENSDDEEMTH